MCPHQKNSTAEHGVETLSALKLRVPGLSYPLAGHNVYVKKHEGAHSDQLQTANDGDIAGVIQTNSSAPAPGRRLVGTAGVRKGQRREVGPSQGLAAEAGGAKEAFRCQAGNSLQAAGRLDRRYAAVTAVTDQLCSSWAEQTSSHDQRPPQNKSCSAANANSPRETNPHEKYQPSPFQHPCAAMPWLCARCHQE